MKSITLLYHDVVGGDADASGFPGADANIYKIEPANFAAHLARIGELGEGRVRVLKHHDDLASPSVPILLTFDDGGASAHESTAKLLEACGWRGHFFIVTERIGQRGFVTREQIHDLFRRGHHIGSHSHSHPASFSRLGWDRMVDEWTESRRILEDILGAPVWCASVPGGYYSREVARSARAAGYRVLFNSEPSARVNHLDGLMILGRYVIRRRTSADAAQALARADFLPRARQTLTWNAKKPLKKVGGRRWLSFRRWFFERSAR